MGYKGKLTCAVQSRKINKNKHFPHLYREALFSHCIAGLHDSSTGWPTLCNRSPVLFFSRQSGCPKWPELINCRASKCDETVNNRTLKYEKPRHGFPPTRRECRLSCLCALHLSQVEAERTTDRQCKVLSVMGNYVSRLSQFA